MVVKASKFDIYFSTLAKLGLISRAPGTLGSIATFPIVWIINNILIRFIDFNDKSNVLANISLLYIYHFFMIVIIFFIGLKAADNYSYFIKKEDPKEVIIDEVAGQYLTIWLCAPGANFFSDKFSPIISVILMLVLFRFFDILKPWPIKWFETTYKNGFGIMVDDIIAGIMAAIFYYVIILI